MILLAFGAGRIEDHPSLHEDAGFALRRTRPITVHVKRKGLT